MHQFFDVTKQRSLLPVTGQFWYNWLKWYSRGAQRFQLRVLCRILVVDSEVAKRPQICELAELSTIAQSILESLLQPESQLCNCDSRTWYDCTKLLCFDAIESPTNRFRIWVLKHGASFILPHNSTAEMNEEAVTKSKRPKDAQAILERKKKITRFGKHISMLK